MLTCKFSANQSDISLGEEMIAKGKVGSILLAGGMGSRLGWQGAKGTFPLSLVKKKTLFDLFYERAFYLTQSLGAPLHLAVMSSPLNYEQTREVLPKEVDVFEQKMLPFLDEKGRSLKVCGPDGNGGVFTYFCQSPIYKKWKEKGVEYIQIALVDNPLGDCLDPNQIGVHARDGAEISLKVIDRTSPQEQVGMICEREGKPIVIEYMENQSQEGLWANTSLFCFHLSFIEKIHAHPPSLHRVKKKVDGCLAYKQERFLFDLLPLAEEVCLIHYPREETFAPLKEKKDVEKVQQALLRRDRQAFFTLSGLLVEDQIFELDPLLYFPKEEIREKWKGRPLPATPYVEP